jgi:glycine/D-amino acid oxidase-like deaminating enzyme
MRPGHGCPTTTVRHGPWDKASGRPVPGRVSEVDRRTSLADAVPISFWLDDPVAPPAAPQVVGRISADLAIVGGGYTGLWTALLAKSDDPGCEVLVLEADRCGWAASGRNGGFCAASLTHGLANGIDRFPDEIAILQRLGRQNLDAIEATVTSWSMDCGFERTGDMAVATEPYQVDELARAAVTARAHGDDVDLLDVEQVRAEVHSPAYLAGLWDRSGSAMVNPARLAWGLRQACEDAGVRIYEHSAVDGIEAGEGAGRPLEIRTSHGQVVAHQVAVGTNAYPSPVRRLRRYVVPVYDYVLMTEPLSAEQLRSIGWESRQGLAGCGNQFLYYRLSQDNRILFGGYDAIYHYGNGLGPSLEQRGQTFEKLAQLFVAIFPQLDDVRFTHSWAGAIDTCSRFCAFFDLSMDGRLASVAGYTGLGVGASRFGARAMLDLLSGERTELTELDFVRRKPLPFPPEPLRFVGIQLTRWSMAKADRNGGRRNAWLQTLDRLGVGFDS